MTLPIALRNYCFIIFYIIISTVLLLSEIAFGGISVIYIEFLILFFLFTEIVGNLILKNLRLIISLGFLFITIDGLRYEILAIEQDRIANAAQQYYYIHGAYPEKIQTLYSENLPIPIFYGLKPKSNCQKATVTAIVFMLSTRNIFLNAGRASFEMLD